MTLTNGGDNLQGLAQHIPPLLKKKFTELLDKKDWDTLIPMLSDILSLLEGEGRAGILTARGIAYFYKGNSEDAFADYNRAIEINPDMSLAYYFRAQVHAENGDRDSVIADLNKAEELQPGVVDKEIRGLLLRICGD